MKKLILVLILLASFQLQAQWKYTNSTDEMTGRTEHFAVTNSINKINFQFPYDGGTTFQLLVRNMGYGIGYGNDVLLIASKGQFLYESYVTFKFDYSKPFSRGYGGMTDGSTNVIAVSSSGKIIRKLKDARLLKIEAPFYQDGRKIIIFDVSNFKWNY